MSMKINKVFLPITALLLLGVFLTACAGGAATVAGANWPGLTVDAQNQIGYVSTGAHVYAVDLKNGQEKWRYPATAERNLTFSAPPTLTPDGLLVVGAVNHKIYGLDAQTGQLKWTNEGATNRFFAHGLAMGSNTFIPGSDHNLYALDASGSQVWKFATDGPLWGAPVSDGTKIYLPGMDHKFYALDSKTGKLIWQTDDLGGSMSGSPALSQDGKLYIGTFKNELLAIDTGSGKVLWRQPVGGWIYSSPVLDNGVLYFGDLSGTLYAYDAATGALNWKQTYDSSQNGEISSTPLVTADRIYFSSKGGVLYAVDRSNGAKIWTSLEKDFGNKNGKSSLGKLYAPIQSNGDTILITPMGAGPTIIAIDADGNKKWDYTPAR
jgi:eukaryotic-like serine/threonine-protein kinase